MINALKSLADADGSPVDSVRWSLLYHSLIDVSRDLTAITDSDGVVRFVSHQCRDVLGYPPEKFIGFSFPDIIHPDDRAHCLSGLHAVLSGRPVFDFEYRIVDEEKKIRWVSHSGRMVVESGKPSAIIYTMRNITDRRAAEAALHESELRFWSAFAHAPIGMAIVLPNGRWLKVNAAATRILGYSEEELQVRDFQSITLPDDLEKSMFHVNRLLSGIIANYEIEKRYVHREGHSVWVLLNVSLVRDDTAAPLHFIAQFQDISERKKSEENLKRTFRLQAAGALSAAITHELNQPLNALCVSASSLLKYVETTVEIDPQFVTKLSSRIVNESERMARAVLQMRQLGSTSEKSPEHVSLCSAVLAVEKILDARFAAHGIRYIKSIPDTVAQICAVFEELEMILVNILTNALHAVLANDARPRVIQLTICEDGAYVDLRIRDSGTGFGEAVFHAFEPFYSTKPSSQGMGLGLAIVQSVIRSWNADIAIADHDDGGAEVHLRFCGCCRGEEI